MVNNKNKSLPLVLLILDGFGLSKEKVGNAVYLANTPHFDFLMKNYPFTKLCAHGECVGLPHNQDGNSEAGHMNIGAGRIVEQDSVYIAKSISDGTFFHNKAFRQVVDHVKKNKGSLHLMGLLSNGESAHANPDHLIALLTFSHFYKLRTYLHFFTDGRDTYQYSALDLLKKIGFYIRENQRIATLAGRFWAMDRKKAWIRTKKVYELLTEGKGLKYKTPEEAVKAAYRRGENDEFLSPSFIQSAPGPKRGTIKNGDGIIFYNLRSDRARQLTKAFVQDKFAGFKRKKILRNIFFVAMTDFGPDLPRVVSAYPSRDLKGTLPMVLQGLRQLYLAETEKYAHVTYFFNGGYDRVVAGEDRIMIPSPEVDNYSQTPEMKTPQLAEKVIDFLEKDRYDIMVVNIACPDMVGHTGNLEAGIKAVEATDRALGKIREKILKKKGVLIVTADHGNVEEMIDIKTGKVDTAHSKNPVPFILVSDNKRFRKAKLRQKGVLGDIAPTILDVLGIKKGEEMTGKSLIKNN